MVQVGDTLGQGQYRVLTKLIDDSPTFSATAVANGIISVTRPLGTSSHHLATVTEFGAFNVSNWTQKTYTLLGNPSDIVEGDVWSVVVDTTTFNYTVVTGDDFESISAGLAQSIEADPAYQATQVGSQLVIVRAAAAPAFTASVGRSFVVPVTTEIKMPSVDSDGNTLNDFMADRVYVYGNSAKDDQFTVESTTDTITATRRITADNYVMAYTIHEC